MKFLASIAIYSLLCITTIYCTSPSLCPPCVNTCPVNDCNCTDSSGNLFLPLPPPTQLPRPSGCSHCLQLECPLVIIECPLTPSQCTEEQLETYIPVCPACVSQAGCQQFGCDCLDCHENLLTPATNPPQPHRPEGCNNCSTDCLKAPMLCLSPTEKCTDSQLSTYVPKCPPCVPQAGCQQTGCFCVDCYGNIMIPAVNPPQPTRPDGCPACNTICDEYNITCPSTPSQCSAVQIAKYDYKNSPCFVRDGKC